MRNEAKSMRGDDDDFLLINQDLASSNPGQVIDTLNGLRGAALVRQARITSELSASAAGVAACTAPAAMTAKTVAIRIMFKPLFTLPRR